MSIGQWHDRASDWVDVPMVLLKTMEKTIRLREQTTCRFDAEGYEYILVFDEDHTFVITKSEDDPDYHTFTDIPFGWLTHDIVHELTADIRRNLKEWAALSDDGDMSLDQKEEREKDLLCLCDVVEKRYSWWVK